MPVTSATAAGREFFADHRVHRSHRTGEVVDQAFSRFPFPPQWHFDIMRALEYFRAAGAATFRAMRMLTWWDQPLTTAGCDARG